MVEHALFDDPVRSPEDRRRDRQPERLRGLEVDDELKFRGLLDGEVSGLRTIENLVHLGCRAPKQILRLYAVSHQAAGVRKLREWIHSRQSLLRGGLDNEVAVNKSQVAGIY